MEFKVKKIREELDALGYYQTLTPESAPLVEKLVADLKTTTESLQKYMKIAQNAIEEKNNLELGAEPYKCDNARLVKECNELSLTLLQQKEKHDKIQKDLSRRLELLKAENCDSNSERNKLKNQIKKLEAELINQGEILLNPKQKAKPTGKSQSTTTLREKTGAKARSFELNSAMALADQKISNLSRDLRKLKEQNLQLLEANEILQSQLNNRDKEIKRLGGLLEGGRPLNAIKKDCSCSCNKIVAGSGIDALQDEISKILQEKHVLENRLKESLAKQHEAMARAVHLAERNETLEKEMKDIDHLALAVEAECNNTVKNHAEKLNRLQDRMHESVVQIQHLERENSKLRQEKQQMNAELDAIVVEKRHLQTVLETSLEDKKRLTDKINNFTIIENDLNLEIDRLNRLSAEQKRKIAELECSLLEKEPPKDDLRTISRQSAEQVTQRIASKQSQEPIIQRPSSKMSKSPEMSPTRSKNKAKKKKITKRDSIPVAPPSGLQVPANTPKETPDSARCCSCCCEVCSSSKHLKDLLDKELEYREQQASRCIENLRSEKEYYMREYHKVLEAMKNTPVRPSSGGKNGQSSELLQKLLEKEQSLAALQQENKILAQDKFSLLARLESARDRPDSGLDGPCLKPNCKRNERERDLLRADLERAEEERDALKQKLKGVSDSQINETERLQKRLREAEEEIHKLEQERRELVQNQGSRRATIDTLEEQCGTVKEQLRIAQNELNQQRALYTQLKTLHEQTDRSLSDTQSKLVQAEAELADALDSLKRRDQDRGTVSKEVDLLKNDIQIMKSQLAQIDREKDELLVALDDKTEKLAHLEMELKSKDKTISSLEAMVNELKKKLSKNVDESAAQEHQLRSCQAEMTALRQELDTVRQIKDGAIQENRRLQDDIASLTCDCRDSRKELELYRRQVDDLKTQLQHYVAEIKRTEDLISNKEIERNELLDQFRSLSHDVNILESSNHTLENEATQSKVQLSVALDHAADLERKLENKESIIMSYEKQIADLTSQIASLEMQLKQFMSQYERSDEELQSMRETIVKLETENSKYKRQLRDRDDERLQADRNVDKLRSEREVLQHSVARDRHNVESVERDLHEAKHETSELRLLNRDLHEEVQRLKLQVQELRDKLQYCPCGDDMRKMMAFHNSENSSKTASNSNSKCPIKPDGSDNPSKIGSKTALKSTNTLLMPSSMNKLFSYVSGDPKEYEKKAKGSETYRAEFCSCGIVAKNSKVNRSQVTSEVSEDEGVNKIVKCQANCCQCTSVKDDCDFRSSLTYKGPEVQSYMANYTIVHSPKSYSKK